MPKFRKPSRPRRLYFEQITDSRFIPKDDCLPVLQERVCKIEKLLTMEGIDLKIGEPYLIDWTEVTRNHNLECAEKNPSMREYYLKEAENEHIQYRADFWVKKITRKVTWNDIMRLVNSVNAVPYDFK